MRIRAARDDRNNARDAQLRALLDDPLHAIELEDRESQGDAQWQGRAGHFFTELELDSVVMNGGNRPLKNLISG